eukprot:GHUV01018358.1.p1 GENE.GHUV01018358.1~~GHUV01018358.1.p1  ORF type:complete len:364 (+),score=121.47 GHUV01018358.1:521-1612(+)
MALGVPDPKAPPAGLAAASSLGGMQLGINMPALAVPLAASGESGSGKGPAAAAAGSIDTRAPEEVVLCFGIIDILQDYSTRKVLERAVKGVTHDKNSISVAPPKLYAKRFLEFTTKKVFMSQTEYTQLRNQQLGEQSSMDYIQQQGPQPAPVLQQTPWTLPPLLTSINGTAAIRQAQEDEQTHVATGDGLPLATEDSFPYPPGQLGSSGSGIVASAPEAAPEPCGHSDVPSLPQVAHTAADTALQHGQATGAPPAQEPLLELLAAPIGLDLTSPVVGAASGDAEAVGKLVSAEQVSVTVLEDGGVNGIVEPVKQKLDMPVQSKSSEQAMEQPEQQHHGKGLVSTCAHGSQRQQGASGIIVARG